MISALEDSLYVFLSSPQTHLPFPPRPSFHRKVCSLVASQYGLDQILEPYGTAPLSTGDPQPVRLVLVKTPHSAAPKVRLADLADRPLPADTKSDTRPDPAAATKFLKRPDKKVLKVVPGGLATNPVAPHVERLRSITEEDYRKARARIFRGSDTEGEATAREKSPDRSVRGSTDESVKVIRAPRMAKGPVEGTVGFDRRRNRRLVQGEMTHGATGADKVVQKKVATAERSEGGKGMVGGVENGQGGSRTTYGYGRAAQERRAAQEQGNGGSVVGVSNGGGVGTGGGYGANGVRRKPLYSGEHKNDRQDPDFDRRYDKWAVRTAPAHPQQHMPVPVFGQLLYPYNMQAGTQPLNPSALHLRNGGGTRGQMQGSGVGQYQSMPLHHTPTGTVMFQHVGQGVNGLMDYAGRGLRVPEHGGIYDSAAVEKLGISHSREMSTLQHTSLPAQITRAPSPAYGLDSTVDFPPLP